MRQIGTRNTLSGDFPLLNLMARMSLMPLLHTTLLLLGRHYPGSQSTVSSPNRFAQSSAVALLESALLGGSGITRCQLRKVSPFVKDLCKKHDLPYNCASFLKANALTISTLKAAALQAGI
ncbi:hypothetical protein HAX54_049797 [Datura stramonium]|uniref:Uncharacterized protein n=1 Tax=Datura stramonium TaxID=4076 RepID=A0ABS8WPI9_DATST|nr:hypothetical protein [Datura stramonium]